jgi:hypothetical protein
MVLAVVLGQAASPFVRPAVTSQPAGGQILQNPYAALPKFYQGQVVNAGNWQFTVTGSKWMDEAADRSFPPRLQSGTNRASATQGAAGPVGSSVKPRQGMLFLGVSVTASNKGSQPAAPKDFLLIDAQGRRYAPDSIANGSVRNPIIINIRAEAQVGGIWQLPPGQPYAVVLLDDQGRPVAQVSLRPIPLSPKPKLQQTPTR